MFPARAGLYLQCSPYKDHQAHVPRTRGVVSAEVRLSDISQQTQGVFLKGFCAFEELFCCLRVKTCFGML